MKDKGTCITAAMKKDRDELKKVAHDYILTLEKAARDSKVAWEKEHKLRQEAEGELTVLKGIETNRVKEVQVRSGQLQEELDRVKLDNNNLYTRAEDSLEVNERHRELNGKLQSRITELEQENLELYADNKKISHQIEDQVQRARKAGL